MLLMVDDDRFPLRARRSAGRALDPLPHARLLSADRRGRERGGDAARGDPGNAADHHLASARAARSTRTQAAPAWRRRSRRGISDGDATPHDAAYQTDALIAEDIDAYLDQHQHKTLLRFITCGSVDDGKSTLIGRLLYDSQDDLRGSARRARGRQQARRHAGAGDRFRAAGRRPRRRARAGHHDRRRLSLLRDREAQVHRRRHARATSNIPATW